MQMHVVACEIERRCIWKMELLCDALRLMAGRERQFESGRSQIDTQWGLRDIYQDTANVERKREWVARREKFVTDRLNILRRLGAFDDDE